MKVLELLGFRAWLGDQGDKKSEASRNANERAQKLGFCMPPSLPYC